MIKNNKILFSAILVAYFFFNLLTNSSFIFADAPSPWQITVQEPATSIMLGIITFHNFLLSIILGIGAGVSYLLLGALHYFEEHKRSKSKRRAVKIFGPRKFSHASALEFIWTIVPAAVLIYIAGPSFSLLYALDDNRSRSLVIKVIGHQWYWSYEVPDVPALESGVVSEYLSFDSYLTDPTTTIMHGYRLLEVDMRLCMPVHIPVTLIITSADVIHSWAVPSFGVKIDACPGRLTHITLTVKRIGVFYGQCSEICGSGHGFMPIVVQTKPMPFWKHWVEEYVKDNFSLYY